MNELNTREKFLLIAINMNDGKIPNTLNFRVGLATAQLIDLLLGKHIILDDDNIIIFNNYTSTDNTTDNTLLDMIKYKETNDFTYWLKHAMDMVSIVKEETVEKLILDGVISRSERKRFILFKEVSYSILNEKTIDELNLHISEAINTDENNEDILSLITLIYACNFSNKLEDEDYSLLQGKMDEIREEYCLCCAIMDSIADIKDTVNQYYMAYYNPMF